MSQKENPIISLLFNIVLPVVILNHGARLFPDLGALPPLILAIALPVGYGLRDYFTNNRNKNPLSIIGALNVFLSGGFAVLKLEGHWFAVKEAFFPLALGVWFLLSAFSKSSLMKWMVNKTPLFQSRLIESRLDSKEKKISYENLLKKSTIYLALCFFFSSILNLAVGLRVFTPVDNSAVTHHEHQVIINQQIADMTWISFLIIGLPLTFVSGYTLWWFISQIKKLTSLSLEQIINVDHGKSKQPQTPPQE